MQVNKVEEASKMQDLRERARNHEAKLTGHQADSKKSVENGESAEDEGPTSKSKKTFGRTPDGTGMLSIPNENVVILNETDLLTISK